MLVDSLLVASTVVLWIVVIAEGTVLLGLVRKLAVLKPSSEPSVIQIESGEKLPDTIVSTLVAEGRTRLDTSKDQLLFFSSSSCSACKQSVAEFEEIASNHRHDIEAYLVSVDEAGSDTYSDIARRSPVTFIDFQSGGNGISETLGLKGTPAFVHCKSNGLVISAGYPDRYRGHWSQLMSTSNEEVRRTA